MQTTSAAYPASISIVSATAAGFAGGAVAGGLNAAIYGGNIWQSALYGGLMGAAIAGLVQGAIELNNWVNSQGPTVSQGSNPDASMMVAGDNAVPVPSSPPDPENWNRVIATREGLVGKKTATGHIIKEADEFVALPSREALHKNVDLFYRGTTIKSVPVKDVGPWNTKDAYWLTKGARPLAESRPWTNKAGIDLSNKIFRDLGVKGNDYIYWRFSK
jgi:hypothetical protein